MPNDTAPLVAQELRGTQQQTGWAHYELEDGGPRWAPDLLCMDCGVPHYVDCSLPSEIWNQIAHPHEMLCPNCIDKRLDAAGLTCNQAEFYFVGKTLSSKLYSESHGDVAKLERDVATAMEALEAAETWQLHLNVPCNICIDARSRDWCADGGLLYLEAERTRHAALAKLQRREG